MNSFHAAGHEVHEEIVAEGLRGGEVGFAAAHGADLLDELHEREVAGEHEGVDHDVGAFAAATSSRVSEMTRGSRPKAFL